MTEPAYSEVRSHRGIVGRTLLATVVMFGFGYAMVPLYDIICDITGLNGKTGRVSTADVESELQRGAEPVDAAPREVIVEFVASVNSSGSWVFRPNEATMTVTPGELYQTSYYAENLSASTVVGQATPSVSPFTAARYFNKTECFCFTRQVFEPNSSLDMPVTFVIDPDLPVNVDRVTLSYTFFNSPDQQT